MKAIQNYVWLLLPTFLCPLSSSALPEASTPTEKAQGQQLVPDPSFELGNRGSWIGSSGFNIDSRFRTARTGRFHAYLAARTGSAANNLDGLLVSPTILLPSSAQAAELRFWYRITSEEPTSSTRDRLEVYLVRSENRLTPLSTLTSRDRTGSIYRERTLTIPPGLAGQELKLLFRGTTDGRRPTLFRLDDITLEVLSPTSGPPVVTTRGADQIIDRGARLNLFANPNGESTNVWFTIEEGDPTPDGESDSVAIGAGTGRRQVSITVSGLHCGTQYFFAAQAQNRLGSSEGVVRDFTTAACPPSGQGGRPVAATGLALDVTDRAATLTSQVNPNGLTTEAWFDWGEGANVGNRTSRRAIGDGSIGIAVTERLVGLQCGHAYSFSGRAANSAGEASGLFSSFTTLPCPPTGGAPRATTGTGGPSTSQAGRGDLTGYVNPNGSDTLAFFEWGTTTLYGQTTRTLGVGGGTADLALAEVIDGLHCGTIYHFRVVASNSFGTAFGRDQTFAATPCQPPASHPMEGVWSGTVVGHPATLSIGMSGSTLTTKMTLVGSGEPLETLTILRISETSLLLRRSAEIADLELFRSEVGGQTCLLGNYLEAGSSRPIALCKSTFPMSGIWTGTVASYTSTLTIAQSSGTFSAYLSMATAHQPWESLTIRLLNETSLNLYRPADDAFLELTRRQSSGQACLEGQYLDGGTRRPITLCQVP